MKLNIVLLAFVATLLFGGSALSAHGTEVEVRIWPVDEYDRYCAYEEQDYFIMVERRSYVTVLVVDPSGYADVIYPLARERRVKLYPGRVYRLSELLGGRHLHFGGMTGTAYISVVATRRPVFINDWLLDEYYRYAEGYGGGFSLSVELGLFWEARFHRHGYFAASLPVVFGNVGHHHDHAFGYTTGIRVHHFREIGWRTRSKRYTPYHRPKIRGQKYYGKINEKSRSGRKRNQQHDRTWKKRRPEYDRQSGYYDRGSGTQREMNTWPKRVPHAKPSKGSSGSRDEKVRRKSPTRREIRHRKTSEHRYDRRVKQSNRREKRER